MSKENKQAFPIQIILRICSIGHILSQIHPSCPESACTCWKAAECLQVRLFRHCSLDHLVGFCCPEWGCRAVKVCRGLQTGVPPSHLLRRTSVYCLRTPLPLLQSSALLPKPHPSKWGVWYSCLASCQKETSHSKHHWEPSMIVHKTGRFLQAESMSQERLQHQPPSVETTSALLPRIRC